MSSVKSFIFLIARLVLVLGVFLCQVQPALALARNRYSLGKGSTMETSWHRRVQGRRIPTNKPGKVVPLSGFSMVVSTHNTFDPVDQEELTKTLQDYLTDGMMDICPNTKSSTLEASPSPNQSSGNDYTGSVLFFRTAPSVENVHDREQDLLLAFSAVQAAVDGNPAIAQNARVEQVIARDKSVVALADFTIVVTTSDTSDPVDEALLTKTLEDYLTTAIKEDYPNALVVTLENNAVGYNGHVVFSDTAPPSFQDLQARGQELLLDISAIQAAMDSNPVVEQDARLEQVTVGGSGSVVTRLTSVALPAYIIIVNTSDDDGAVDQNELTKTLENHLTAGVMKEFDNTVAVTWNGTPNQMDPNAFDYTGYVVISDAAPSVDDVQDLAEELLLDLTAVQAAVDANPAIGQDTQVEQVSFDGTGDQVGSSTSSVALLDFTIVVNTNEADGTVDQAQLKMTLRYYLAAGIMNEYSSVADVALNGTPNQMDPNAVDYTGYATFSSATPPIDNVQALAEDLLLNLTAVQAAVDGNPTIGKDARVEQVAIGGTVCSSTSAVALPDFTIVVNTSEDDGAVDKAQLKVTLQDYLANGIMEEYPSVTDVALNGTPNQMDSKNAVDYTGYVVISNATPPINDVQALVEELLLDTDAVQAAVDDNPAIGQDAQVEQVVVGGKTSSGPSISTVVPTPTPPTNRITDMPAGTPSNETDTAMPTFAPPPTPTPPTDTITDMPTGTPPTGTDTNMPTKIPTPTPPTNRITDMPAGTPSNETDTAMPTFAPPPTPTPPTDTITDMPTGTPLSGIDTEMPTKMPTPPSGIDTEMPTKISTPTPPPNRITDMPAGTPSNETDTAMPTFAPPPTPTPPTDTNTDMPTKIPTPTPPTNRVTDMPAGTPSNETETGMPTPPTDTINNIPTTMPSGLPLTDTFVVPVSFTMLVTTHNILDPVNPTELIQTVQDYLMAGMMQAYPNSTAVTVTLEASPNESDNNNTDYTGSIVFFDTTANVTVSSLEDVQAVAQALILDMAAVQAAVDANPAVTQSQNPTARVEQIIAGNRSAVALSSFTMVVTTNDTSVVPVDRVQLTETLEQYLTADMMEKYPNAVDVLLSGTAFNNSGGQSSSTAVDYSGYVIFSDATPPSFRDVQAWQQELLLDLTALQEAVDSNPAIGQDTTVDQVAVDGSGGQVGTSTSVVALPDFTIVVNTRNGTDPANQAELTITLQDYLMASILEEYPSVVAVTLNSTPNQMDPTTVEYTGNVELSGTTPPAEDVQALVQELLLDLTALQAAVDGNPAIGQDAQVEQVFSGGSGGSGLSASAVVLTAFTMVVNTSDNDGAVDQAQLIMTLQDYLLAGMMDEYPNGVAVPLVGNRNQMTPLNAVDYAGYVIFSGTAPEAEDVQAKAEELLLDWAAVQSVVSGNPAIGQHLCVQQVALDGSGGEVVASTSVVSLSDFSIVVTSDGAGTVDDSKLTKTLEDYLTAGMMEEYTSGDVVTLDGRETQIDGSDVFDYTGYVSVCNTSPPSAGEVEMLGRDLMLDLTDVQAAVDADLGIGSSVRVERVVVGDDSVVALSDFTIVIQSDDFNTVNQTELARTLEDYLMTGLMQDFPDVEAVVLQPQQTQQNDTILFSGHAMFAGSAPDFREVQSNARGLLRDTRAVQTAVDSNRAIGENVIVSGIESVGDDDDNDDSNTAKIVGGVVGASAFCLALAIIFMARGRRNPVTDGDNEEAPLASTTPLLPSGVVSKPQQDAAATVSD